MYVRIKNTNKYNHFSLYWLKLAVNRTLSITHTHTHTHTQDWVKLAVNRARASGDPAIFWLNKAHILKSPLYILCYVC
jgi:hypothetical protein